MGCSLGFGESVGHELSDHIDHIDDGISKSIDHKLSDHPMINGISKSIDYKLKKKKIDKIYKKSIYSYNSKKHVKKINLNILYYDENLNNEENSDNSSFLFLNIDGTFYGCHYFELFKIVLEKIKNNNKEFILISSGSSAKKIFDYCSNIKEIKEYYIYCYQKEKYISLLKEYPKLKGVYNNFEQLKCNLYNLPGTKNEIIKSSNLMSFEDYNSIYIKLHYEFIIKYDLYKKFKAKSITEEQFLSFIKKKEPYFLELAEQIFPDKNEIIDFFINNTNESPILIRNIFDSDDNIKSYIRNYTLESFYYKYLNKFLREGDFNAFRILSSHISKFIYNLYDYREKNIAKHEKLNLYRKFYINKEDIKLYKNSEGRVICYPAFTSTSIEANAYTPYKVNPSDELVQLIIEQNNTKSAVSISEFSKYPDEKEYLFLPFSFFKIKNVEIHSGSKDNPHIVNLIAIETDKPIEEMFVHFFKNETDGLNPEGLDMLKLCNNNTKIVFNEIYFKNKNQK